MPDKMITLLRREQEKIKPIIEDLIPEYLDGDIKKVVQNFVTYLQDNNLPLKWANLNTWTAGYKRKILCFVSMGIINDERINSWRIALWLTHISKYDELIMNEGLHTLFWDNAEYCVHSSGQSGKGCNPSKACAGGDNRIIFGKEFKGIRRCSQNWILAVKDPDEKTVNGIKRLLAFEQMARNDAN